MDGHTWQHIVDRASDLSNEIAESGDFSTTLRGLLQRLGAPEDTLASRIAVQQALCAADLGTKPGLAVGKLRSDSRIRVFRDRPHARLPTWTGEASDPDVPPPDTFLKGVKHKPVESCRTPYAGLVWPLEIDEVLRIRASPAYPVSELNVGDHMFSLGWTPASATTFVRRQAPLWFWTSTSWLERDLVALSSKASGRTYRWFQVSVNIERTGSDAVYRFRGTAPRRAGKRLLQWLEAIRANDTSSVERISNSHVVRRKSNDASASVSASASQRPTTASSPEIKSAESRLETTLVGQLRELTALYKSGALSDSEFEQAKRRLISG